MYNRFLRFMVNEGSDTPARRQGLVFAEAILAIRPVESQARKFTYRRDDAWRQMNIKIIDSTARFVVCVVQEPLFYTRRNLLSK